MQRRSLGTAIRDVYTDQDVFAASLGVLDVHIEVAVLIEHARIE